MNILLDIVLIAWVPMGVAGAALATVLSQAAAAAWVPTMAVLVVCYSRMRKKRLLRL